MPSHHRTGSCEYVQRRNVSVIYTLHAYVIVVTLCRYGYTHYIHVKLMMEKEVKFFWQDVACQYWPYAVKVTPPTSSALQMTPCLPVMHAKAHTWHCQVCPIHCCDVYTLTLIIKVLWGGRWQDGAAAGSGEDMEQFFSYLSRWSSSTKSMLAYSKYFFLITMMLYS